MGDSGASEVLVTNAEDEEIGAKFQACFRREKLSAKANFGLSFASNSQQPGPNSPLDSPAQKSRPCSWM